MQTQELTDVALRLHDAYSKRALATGRRPWTREEVVQGLVVDVGELVEASMAKSGIREIPDCDAKFRHEIADCLWSILVLGRLHGIDVEREMSLMVEQKLAALGS